MLFKSAATTWEKKNKTSAQHPCLQGRKQQLQLPDTSPLSRSRACVGEGGAEPGRGDTALLSRAVCHRGERVGWQDLTQHLMLQKGRCYSNGFMTVSLPSVWYSSVILGWSQHVVWAWWLEGK